MSKIINVGRVTSYADAVAGGYTGTREQWEHDLANLGTVAAEVEADRAEVAENTATVAEDKAAVEEDRSAAESAAGSAAESAASAHTDAIAATAAKEAAQTAQGLAENAASTAANAKDAAQTAQGAAEDAQTAAEAAQTAAETAETHAETAQDKAEDAQEAAETAQAAAEAVLESIPEDYSEMSADVTDLKSAIDAVSDTGEMTIAGSQNANMSGGMVTNASYARSVYYALTDEKNVTVTKTPGQTFAIGFTTQVPASGVAVSDRIFKNISGSITSVVPTGAKYLMVYYYNTNIDTIPEATMRASLNATAIYGAIDTDARADIAILETKTAEVSGLVAFRDDTATHRVSSNLFDGELLAGYISKDGTLTTGGTYKHTNKIDVHDLVGQTIYYYNDGTQKYIRFVCIYDENNNVKSALGTDNNDLTFTIPTGAYYAVLSFTGSSVTTPYCVITTDATKTIYVPHRNEWKINGYDAVDGAVNIPVPVELRSASLATGESISGDANSVKRLGTYVFYCKPGTMTEDAYIIFGKDTSKGYAVGISATKWAWFVNNVSQGEGDHNLTIKDYLLVVVDKVPGTGAVLTIYTNGGTYTRTNTSWLDDHGAPYVRNESGDTITDVKMSWTSSAFRNRNWVFGDSYVTIATPRWPKYVYDLGFGDNLMINGYPGEQSETGYKDLLDCIKRGMPSVLAWCLGMNDADDGAVNASWLKYVQAFLELCALYDITPILATIPCCPIADHQYKNAWVRASGYRYIDFASAVNVSQDSTTWYDDMLADDNIHPTAQGAIALASQVLTDFPELLVK